MVGKTIDSSEIKEKKIQLLFLCKPAKAVSFLEI